MARIKNKVARITVYLNKQQDDALAALMREAMSDTASAYIGGLIAKEWNTPRKGAQAKRASTTPSGTASDEDEPRDVPHPDDFANPGVMMNRSEYEAYMAMRRGEFPR